MSIWRDLVATTVKDNVLLQRKLIGILERDDIYEAAYWAKRLEIKDIPTSVCQLLKNIKQGLDSFPPDEENIESTVENLQNIESSTLSNTGAASWGDTDWSSSPWPSETSTVINSGYYEFPLKDSDIRYIDDRRGLCEFLDYLRSSTEVRTHLGEFPKSDFVFSIIVIRR